MSPRKAPTNPAASVRARLLNLAHARSEEFQLILSDFATERFLYRLSASPYAERFVLKGAMLLRLWSPDRYRATWDVDLLGRQLASAEAISTALREICAIPAEDGLVFVPDSLVVEDIREAAEHGVVRVRLVWDLAGAKIPMQIDVAVGESVVPDHGSSPTPRCSTTPHPGCWPIRAKRSWPRSSRRCSAWDPRTAA